MALSNTYKFDFQTLEMVSDLIKLVLTGKHTGDDIQKDLHLAKDGLENLINELEKRRLEN